MDVTVKKVWDDMDDTDGLRPDSVKIMLLANGAAPEDLSEENQAEPVDIGEAENWEYTYTGMLKYHQGEEIEYTADEEDVPEGYEKEIDGLTVINSHAYEKVTIHGKKVWDDADDQEHREPFLERGGGEHQVVRPGPLLGDAAVDLGAGAQHQP